ncbi:MAG: hypothetical protein HZA20_03700 [Nitrospirae bacterium]|nr:hypothetical protein [Nitrospirota bacterium]
MRLKIFALMIAIMSFPSANTCAEMIERVIASIDDTPVFLGEYIALKKQLADAGQDIPDREVIDILIDRKLMYQEARRLRFDKGEEGKPADQDAIVERYLDMFVRAFVGSHSNSQSELRQLTAGDSVGDMADDGFRRRLKEKIAELRRRYEIRIDPEM